MVNKSGDATWGCSGFVVGPTLADTDNKPKTVVEEEDTDRWSPALTL